MDAPEPLERLDETWERALCIVAHPDDMEFGAAAAVARWTGQGKWVGYTMVTSGEAGIDAMAPEEAGPSARRSRSSRPASSAWRPSTSSASPTASSSTASRCVRLLAAEVRRHRPDIVITGNHRDTWGGNNLNQADHIAVGKAVLDAVRDAGNRWVFPEQITDDGLEPWGGVRAGLGLRLTAVATHAVDTTDTFDAGVESLKAHAAYIDGLGWENWDPARVPRGHGPGDRPAARRARFAAPVRGGPDGLGRVGRSPGLRSPARPEVAAYLDGTPLEQYPRGYCYVIRNVAVESRERDATMQDSTAPEVEVGTMPRIGDPAPEFTAMTTQGEIRFPADYAGKWVILFSHPADFTPVCTSEFMTFATMQDQFTAYNTELVGLSVDGLYSHIAWLRTIKEKMRYRDMVDVEVTFPLIDDVSMTVARKYGMIMPGEASTQAVRAVFVIDPMGVVRTVLYYPLSLGRNFDELLRIVKALQTADAFGVATPADWRPGERVIVPPAGSCGTAKDRMDGTEEGIECIDWFFCTKELTEAQVEDGIRAS